MAKIRFHIPEQITVYGTIFIIIVASFYFASKFIQPAPPSKITISAGSKGGSYIKYARKYKKLLEKQGLDVTILETAGSVENLKLLSADKADVAFIQGGIRPRKEKDIETMEALGSLYYEPLWVFVRPNLKIKDIRSLKNKRLAIGDKGSGTRSLVTKLLNLNKMNSKTAKLLPLSGKTAFKAITKKKIDAIFIIAGFQSPDVQRLLRSDAVELMPLNRAQAYARHFSFFSKLTLPEGIVDFASNIPNQDVDLLAASAMLIANENLHPALKKLVVHTSFKIHNQRGVFSDKGAFPTLDLVDFPISKEAQHYFEFGPSLLQRYVPFWAADLLDRLKVMLIPLLAIFLPLIKIASPAYRWRVRSKIYKFYKKLKIAEKSIAEMKTDKEKREVLKLLKDMELEAKTTPVPLSYTDALYNLRLHINLVEKELSHQKKPKPEA